VSCLACELVIGTKQVPGGVVWRRDGFILHAVAQATPVRGWMVLTSERHVRAWYDLSEEESAAVGVLAREVMQAQKRVLGAEHVYAFAIGDVLQHFHLHLVPRFADTPPEFRGRGVFEVKVGLPDEEVAHAARSLVR
jgi:diadenosine tetraphosphate (Ap4A) HIT family hydrolase